MFTGLIERLARVSRWQQVGPARRLFLQQELDATGKVWNDLCPGESIAVNGACLTLVECQDKSLAFDVVPETLRCTTLGSLGGGQRVHLERALRVGDRLGGHLVLGHVDAIGRVEQRAGSGPEVRLTVTVEGQPASDTDRTAFRVIPKGSVCIDGVSLTVIDPLPGRFSVALVPHTLRWTTLGERRGGDRVNLEMDHLGKWIQELWQATNSSSPSSSS